MGLATKPCSGCQQPIVWAETVRGKRQPFDPKPEKRVIFRERAGKPPLAIVVNSYTPHHATCPQVDLFRREKP